MENGCPCFQTVEFKLRKDLATIWTQLSRQAVYIDQTKGPRTNLNVSGAGCVSTETLIECFVPLTFS